MVKNNGMVEKDELNEEKIIQFKLDHQTDLRKQLQLYYKTVKQSDQFQQINVEKNEGKQIDYKIIKKSSDDQIKIEHEEDQKKCKKNSQKKMGGFAQNNQLQQNTNLDKKLLKKESLLLDSSNSKKDIKRLEKRKENLRKLDQILKQKQKQKDKENEANKNTIGVEIQQFNINQKKFSSLEEQNYTQNLQINFNQNIQSHEHDEQQNIQQKNKQVHQDHTSQSTTQDIRQQLENLYKKQQMFQQQQQEIAKQQENLVANYLQMDQFQFNYQNTNNNYLKHNNAQINQNFNNQQQYFCFQPQQQIINQQHPYINQNIQYQQPVQNYSAYQQQYQKYQPYQNCTQQQNLNINVNDINYNSYQSNSIIDNFYINNINSELSQAHDFKNQINTDKNSDKSSGKTERSKSMSNKKFKVLTDNNVSNNINKQKQDIQLNKNFLQTKQQDQDVKILQTQDQINDDGFLSHDQNFSDILAKNQQLENDEEDIFNLQIQGKDETKNLLRNIGNAFKNFIESSYYKPIINKMLGNDANLCNQFLIWVKFNSLESFQTYRTALNVQQQISSIENLEEIFQLYGSKYDNFDWEISQKDIQQIQYIILKEFQQICEKLILISNINQVGFNQESLVGKLENDIITAFQNIVIILGMIFIIIKDESFQNYLASIFNLIEESQSFLNELLSKITNDRLKNFLINNQIPQKICQNLDQISQKYYLKNDLVYMQQVFPEKLDQVIKKQSSTFIDTNSNYQKEADKNIDDLEKFKNNFDIEKIAQFKSQNKLDEQFQLNQQINGKKTFSKSQAVKIEETNAICKSELGSNMEVESTKQEKQTEQNNKQQISVLKEQIDKILRQFDFKRQEQ
ncbi:hypothetical protein PPERSA_12993 [Pseudocohnilembus persalinus]|uniref:Uncharacterized protein n=1 Tax=Pseudocohnilembus persalinus TaxID=266149 RepID=A0A0V0R2L4_PSEPJ|nr:hypothetical protein PPERSA_12993 [Pseudocohnilembus persalinus]|eukprot:KRX08512.1 hypothetical protein PPERSA_12993 [Pseudocohnilembus persalinus]